MNGEIKKMATRWTKWMKLDDNNLKELPKASGIYEIKGPKKVHRLMGVDKEGILYIGCGKISSRIKFFLMSARGRWERGWHVAGYRFFNLYLDKKIFSVSKLLFRYRITKRAKNLEGDLLKKYQRKHGELPPLNNSGGY